MTDINKLSLKILYKKRHIAWGAGLPNMPFQGLRSFFPQYINKL